MKERSREEVTCLKAVWMGGAGVLPTSTTKFTLRIPSWYPSPTEGAPALPVPKEGRAELWVRKDDYTGTRLFLTSPAALQLPSISVPYPSLASSDLGGITNRGKSTFPVESMVQETKCNDLIRRRGQGRRQSL